MFQFLKKIQKHIEKKSKEKDRMLNAFETERLYGSLEVDNSETVKALFGEAEATLPYSVEDGIKLILTKGT